MSGKIQKLFEEQDVNISQMSRKTGIPYGTLYDIAIGKTSFDKIKIGALCCRFSIYRKNEQTIFRKSKNQGLQSF